MKMSILVFLVCLKNHSELYISRIYPRFLVDLHVFYDQSFTHIYWTFVGNMFLLQEQHKGSWKSSDKENCQHVYLLQTRILTLVIVDGWHSKTLHFHTKTVWLLLCLWWHCGVFLHNVFFLILGKLSKYIEHNDLGMHRVIYIYMCHCNIQHSTTVCAIQAKEFMIAYIRKKKSFN